MANTKKMDCVILGLLSHETLTGYEIKKIIDTQLKFFWNGSYGSIYPTLNQLERDVLVTKQDTSVNGREKIAYTITKKGREYLRMWLEKPVEKDEIRYETLLKLFFGSENGIPGTLEHIERFEQKIAAELPCLQKAVDILEPIQDTQEAHKYYMLTAMFGVKAYEAFGEWCKEAKKILKQEKDLEGRNG